MLGENIISTWLLISHREKDLTAKCIIRMEGNKTSITNLKVLLSSTRHSDCNSGWTCVLFNYFVLWFPKSSLKASQGSRRGIEPKPSRTTSPTTPWTVRAPRSSPRRRWVSVGSSLCKDHAVLSDCRFCLSCCVWKLCSVQNQIRIKSSVLVSVLHSSGWIHSINKRV